VIAHRVLTTVTSNTTVPIVPTRVVDTRNADLRRRIVNPSVLDSAGRLPKNQTMDVNLNDLASFPAVVPGAMAAAGGGALNEAAEQRAQAIRKSKPVWE
jgi:hypothetical protein